MVRTLQSRTRSPVRPRNVRPVLARGAERTDGPVGHLVAEIFHGVDRITFVFLRSQLVLPTAVALYPRHYYGN